MQLGSIELSDWLTVAIIFGFAELSLQLGLMASNRFRAIGDEIEYIKRGQSRNPFKFTLFHRMPMLPSIAWLAGRFGHASLGLRLLSVVSSSIAMAATAGAATRVGGAGIATFLCLALLFLPERFILGSRIWPDVHLAAATSGIALVLTLSGDTIDLTTSAVLVGLIVSLAVLTRLDGLVLIPAVLASWIAVTGSYEPLHLLSVAGPPIISFVGWWLISATALGEPWPDTTFRFNLGISALESTAQGSDGSIVIDDLVQQYQRESAETERLQKPDRGAAASLHLRAAASRLRAIVGPDTFVTAKLHPEIARTRCSSCIGFLLRTTVPLLMAASITLFVFQPTMVGWLILPALVLLFAATMIHTRTRYRLPMIFASALLLTGSLYSISTHPRQFIELLPAGIVILALSLLLTRTPTRIERQ